MNDFICESREEYLKVAREENLPDPLSRIYATFMMDRVGTDDKAYARKWARRFKRRPIRHMDDESLEAYKEALQEEIEHASSR